MARRETPSQRSVPSDRFGGAEELGGVPSRTNVIGVNRLMTPNGEKIGTGAMPVPTEGGEAEFIHRTHPANGRRK